MNADGVQALERGNVPGPALAFVCCNLRDLRASRLAHGGAATGPDPIRMNLAGG